MHLSQLGTSCTRAHLSDARARRPEQDHFRKVCQPNYVNVYRDRGGVMGVVEFDTADDLDRAVRP